jgi:GNAT superfamily N-acetyltransferase
MDPEILPVDVGLRLRRFARDPDADPAVDPVVDTAWAWYRDVETVALVDGPGSPTYSRDRVASMYQALARQGELYLVERRTPDGWETVGDVTLARDTLPIVIAPGARRQGIGRRVLLRLVDRARALGWSELRVREVFPANDAAHHLFSSLGFVAVPGDAPPAYELRLAALLP